MSSPTVTDALDEYDRYLDASPGLSASARLVLAERVLRQIREMTS